MTASPPFDILETLPGDTDIVSQHPADERGMRDIVESWLLTEHSNHGKHKFPLLTTANRDADVNWAQGSMIWNLTEEQLQVQLAASSPFNWSGPGGKGSPRAWALISGTGLIQKSFGVTSSVQNGTGDFTITWDQAFADNSYPVSHSVDIDTSSIGKFSTIFARTANTLTIHTRRVDSPSILDGAAFSLVAYGDLA